MSLISFSAFSPFGLKKEEDIHTEPMDVDFVFEVGGEPMDVDQIQTNFDSDRHLEKLKPTNPFVKDCTLVKSQSKGIEKKESVVPTRSCKVCLDQVPNAVLIECGHLFCYDCATKVSRCPVCRVSVKRVLRVYEP